VRFNHYLFSLLWFFVSCAYGHDVGLTFATLEESKNNIYVLSVQVDSVNPVFFTAPILPKQCSYQRASDYSQGSIWLRFEFHCKNVLTAEDDLLLPWNRAGVLLKKNG
jgi:hypothetical protein